MTIRMVPDFQTVLSDFHQTILQVLPSVILPPLPIPFIIQNPQRPIKISLLFQNPGRIPNFTQVRKHPTKSDPYTR
jgi:hypothetical protein